jgi:hypothetical protein
MFNQDCDLWIYTSVRSWNIGNRGPSQMSLVFTSTVAKELQELLLEKMRDIYPRMFKVDAKPEGES